MTRLPAAPAMTTLVEAIHPDAPNGAVTVVVRLRVANAVVDQAGIGCSVTTGVLRVVGPEGVTEGVSEGVRGNRTVVRIEVLEAGQIARASGAARC